MIPYILLFFHSTLIFTCTFGLIALRSNMGIIYLSGSLVHLECMLTTTGEGYFGQKFRKFSFPSLIYF